MANNKKNNGSNKDTMSSIDLNLSFVGALEQHNIILKKCCDGQFLQMIHEPTGLSVTIPDGMIDRINYKHYVLQKLIAEIENQELLKSKYRPLT